MPARPPAGTSAHTTSSPLSPAFYARPVVEVARDLVGCVVRHGAAAGVIVETEAYHEREPACHAFVGRTERTRVLFAEPGTAYVYRSYGVHALLNAVCEDDRTGAAVLIRALEPVEGVAAMRSRRGLGRDRDLCSGPGKLTQALGVGLECNDTSLSEGPVRIESPAGADKVKIVVGTRIGITRAVELPWRFCSRDSADLSRPLPAGLAAYRRRSTLAGRSTRAVR